MLLQMQERNSATALRRNMCSAIVPMPTPPASQRLRLPRIGVAQVDASELPPLFPRLLPRACHVQSCAVSARVDRRALRL